MLGPMFCRQCMLRCHAPHPGSRDRTVRLWCVGEESGRPNTEPMVTQHEKARPVAMGACADFVAARLQLMVQLRDPANNSWRCAAFSPGTCKQRNASPSRAF